MNLELGLMLTFGIVALGGVGLAGFVLWLRNRDSESSHNKQDGIKHA
jgi:hypothetical protein